MFRLFLNIIYLRFILVVPILLSFHSTIFSQEVIINIQHPPFNQLKIEDLWKLTLINPTNNTFTVHLKGTLTESQAGLIATGVSRTLNLQPGTRIFTAGNYKELDPDIDYVNKDPRYEESVVRTGGLPSGEYEICVYVIDRSLEAELCSQCIQQSILLVSPPSLISPEDGSTVSIKHPDFIWLPTVTIGGRTSNAYAFKLVERFGGQSVQEAIEKNSAYFTTAVRHTMLTYPSAANDLIEGKEYVWRIQAVDENGNPVGSNNGYSEVWSFILSETAIITGKEITRQEAIDIIVKKIIVPPTLDHDVTAYLGMKPVNVGSVISSFNKDEGEKKVEKKIWFGWINDSPQAFFEHPTRYLFIDAKTGDYKIETYNWWPVLDGESLWMSDEEVENPEVLIFSTIHLK